MMSKREVLEPGGDMLRDGKVLAVTECLTSLKRGGGCGVETA